MANSYLDIKKIVHMTSVHPVFDTRIFHKECVELANGTYNVVLIVPHDKSECVSGVNIVAVSQGRKRFSRVVNTAFEVFRHALKEKADLYHIHDPELLFYGQILRLLGKRVVFDMHENFPKAILNKHWLPPSFRSPFAKIVHLLERFILYRLPIIFAESSYHKDYPWVNTFTVVLNMPKVDFLMDLKEEKYNVPTLGYVGAVTQQRGSIATFQALEILEEKGLPVNFECIGPIRGLQQQIYLQSMDRQISERIKLAGFMAPPEAWKKICKCHIGLAVLQPILNYVESFPTKMFEYMALGIPVIVSEFPLYREVVDQYQCGFCVDPDSPVAIAEAVEKLISDPEEANRMGINGRNAVIEVFNWQYEAEKMFSFYENIFSK